MTKPAIRGPRHTPPATTAEIDSLLDRLVARWHEIDPAHTEEGLRCRVCDLHRFNFLLWHEEDVARSPDVTDARIAQVKRAIDRYNQARNDGIEKVDDWLVADLAARGVTAPADAAGATETPGAALDRLSILELRRYHMREQADRADASAEHRQKAAGRLALEIYMVKVSYHQKPYRRVIMQTYGAEVHASPTDRTHYGRSVLAQSPDSPGSLGMAISEAVEVAATSGGTKKYSLGSVLNHVLMHQTVIGLEALEQMEMAGEYPDVIIGCAGGGSNFAGFAYPFVWKNLKDGQRTRVVAVEPDSCPTLTKGVYTFDYGDAAATAPVVKMHTLGHTFIPPGIHAGGLRYHGMAPSVSALVDHGDIEARAVGQLETFAAAVQFIRSEGIIPAPESAHAVRAAIDEALVCKRDGVKKVIVFNLSGHGHFDMMAYDAYLGGQLENYAYPAEHVAEAMGHLPKV